MIICYLFLALLSLQVQAADYPGVFSRLVAERHAPGMVCLFANGCCGNINHSVYISGKRRSTLELGTALADATSTVWPNLKQLGMYKPRIRSEQVSLQRRRVSEAQLAKAKDIASRIMNEKIGTVPMAETVCILETEAKEDIPLIAEVQVIFFSDDLAIVSLPGEIFVELGLALKRRPPSSTHSSPNSPMAALAACRTARPTHRATTRSSAPVVHLAAAKSSSKSHSSYLVK